MARISGVYEIVNKITGEYYIGSSVDLDSRKKQHFRESTWKKEPNKQIYKDMKQYGKNNFLFKTIWLCVPTELKKYEQIAIEKYNPKYNKNAAYTGLTKEEYNKQYKKENADKIKQYQKQYQKENTDKIKQYQKQYNKQYKKENADKIKQYQKQYQKEKGDSIKQRQKQYRKQQCLYENELLSLDTLAHRFVKQGIKHPVLEAKKYLVE